MRDGRRSCQAAALAAMAALAAAAAMLGLGGCQEATEPATSSVRLIDLYTPAVVQGSVESKAAPVRTEWRFDGDAPPPDEPFASTRGWEAGPGIAGLAVRNGRLVGRTTDAYPLLHLSWPAAIGRFDSLHAVEIRLRVSSGEMVGVESRGREIAHLAELVEDVRTFPWDMTQKLSPGGAMQTVTLRPPRPISLGDLRHLLLRPSDKAGAEFEIESVRLIPRSEYLAGIASGIGWQGLAQIYRETLVARTPEVLSFDVVVPERGWLDLGLGTVEEAPVEFQVDVAAGPRPEGTAGAVAHLLRRTVTTPHRWEPVAVDLADYAGKPVTLRLTLASEKPGALGFWGSPALRSRNPVQRSGSPAGRPASQGVILIWADTLRRDHLSAYGYARDTSPILKRMAEEGTRFDRCVTQATWTKVATPSLMTSLYPSSHGVIDFSQRLPASATTLAEVFRTAGYATLSLSSILFTGQFTNLHQGFEELHEDMSLPDRRSSKSARVYVDRLLPWLERHREGPFFVFLHVSDPHDPYEPLPPENARWSDPAGKARHAHEAKAVNALIAEPLLKAFGMPTRANLEQAGFDADAYVDYDRGWYDGSIRGMDTEIGRLLERVQELGLDKTTLIVFIGDHGEEFLEHGRTFHGQSAYGELANVPLIVRQPGMVPAGRVVAETVETIDVMPSILAAAGLAIPKAAQGQSFLGLLSEKRAGWRSRPAFTERHRTTEAMGAPPPLDAESFAVVDGDWKLIHNQARPNGGPEFELFDTRTDRLDSTNLAAAHPDVVARMSKVLDAWHAKALAERLRPEEGTANLAPEEMERLRSLGYLQ